MDHVGAALRHVSALDEIAKFALGDARAQPVAQRHHAEVGEMRADAQPVEFFGRFDHAQPDISLVQARELAVRRRQRGLLLSAHRSNRCNAVRPRAAPLQFIDRRTDRRLPAPRDLRVARELPRLRHMIVILHEQRIGLARRQHADRFRRHRPAGEPLHRRAEAVRAAEHQMIAAGFASNASTARAAAPSPCRRNAGTRRRGSGASGGEIIPSAYLFFAGARRGRTRGGSRVMRSRAEAYPWTKVSPSTHHHVTVIPPWRASRNFDSAVAAHR